MAKDLEINDDEVKSFPPYKDLEPLLEYEMEELERSSRKYIISHKQIAQQSCCTQ